MTQVISILNRLSPKAGGITRVSLSRAEMLSAHGNSTVIALLEYDAKIADTVRTMRRDGRLAKNVIIKNLFSYYANITEGRLTPRAPISSDDDAMLDVTVVRRIDFISVTGMRIVRFASISGFIFIEEILDTDLNTISYSIMLPGDRPLHFSSKSDAKSHWLEQISRQNLPTVLIADPQRTSQIVANVHGEQIFKILTLHGNHLKKPHSVGAPIDAAAAETLQSLKKCDALVVLTKAQHRDLQLEFGHNPKIHIIGNPLTNFAPTEVVDRDKNLAVVIGRLEALKGIPRIIKNFSLVVDRVPDAKLEIWGSGTHELQIRNTIDLLGLGQAVSMMGYTTNPSGPFKRARMSLAASEREGFGLSFMESLSVGTPVISYRTNYGPEEIITHGEDGFIVDDDASFVDKVVEVFTNDDFFEGATKSAPVNVQRFGYDIIGLKWNELVSSIQKTHKKEHRLLTSIENIKSSAFGHVFVKKQSFELTSRDKIKLIRITQVNRSLKFHDKVNTIAPGTYEIINLRQSDENGDYAFNLQHGNTTYSGPIPKGSMKMELLVP